jgi:hypothetical protein
MFVRILASVSFETIIATRAGKEPQVWQNLGCNYPAQLREYGQLKLHIVWGVAFVLPGFCFVFSRLHTDAVQTISSVEI